MKGSLRILAVVAFVVLVVLVIARMRGGESDDLLGPREHVPLLVCEGCGLVTALPEDFVRQRYEAGEVRPTGTTPRFKCPSCEELAVRVEILDFLTTVVRCEQCGEDLIGNEHAALVAVDAGDVQVGENKQLLFRCSDCGDFHGRIVSRETPMEQE
jgi:predicted RNA-binding Zn-ribbon protein involved in translation (DUF1610 family)